jgi:hypothetical protein
VDTDTGEGSGRLGAVFVKIKERRSLRFGLSLCTYKMMDISIKAEESQYRHCVSDWGKREGKEREKTEFSRFSLSLLSLPLFLSDFQWPLFAT